MVMDEQTIRNIVAEVVAGQLAKPGTAAPGPRQAVADIPVEISARHVHLTTEAVERLFGKGARLTKKRELSQPGEFLSEQRVKLVTAKGEIQNVAVLGPERGAVQVELSLTDTRQLGIAAPINLSGNLEGGGDVCLVSEQGVLEARGSVIAAKNHIHMTPADAARYGVSNGQCVAVAVNSPRPLTFQGVTVRVSESFALAMHLDFDEANACALGCGALGRLMADHGVSGGAASPGVMSPGVMSPGVMSPGVMSQGVMSQGVMSQGVMCPAPGGTTAPCGARPADTRAKVITEAVALELSAAGGATVFLPRGAIVTPSAKDVFIHKGIQLERR